MTKREAQRTIRYAEKLQGIQVRGTRVWPTRGGYSYEVELQDTREGGTFIVRSLDELKERVATAEFWAKWDGD